ncbi:MAG: DUF4099 domain-containing protein, partial [Paludibacter sp.]
QEMLLHPYVPYNKETLDMHRVSSDEISTKQTYQPIDESRIDWNQLDKLGVTRETLEATGSLEAMLNWGKSPVLIPITPKFDDVTKVRKRISKFGKPIESRRMQFDCSEAHSKVGEGNFKSRNPISKFGKPLKSGRSGFHFSESDSNIGGGDYKIRKPIQQFGRGFQNQNRFVKINKINLFNSSHLLKK